MDDTLLLLKEHEHLPITIGIYFVESKLELEGCRIDLYGDAWTSEILQRDETLAQSCRYLEKAKNDLPTVHRFRSLDLLGQILLAKKNAGKHTHNWVFFQNVEDEQDDASVSTFSLSEGLPALLEHTFETKQFSESTLEWLRGQRKLLLPLFKFLK